MKSVFSIAHTDVNSNARTGFLSLSHGEVNTPVFMPVGTNATVKALHTYELDEIGFEILLSNTYHLYLRPGTDVISKAGSLHNWMNWGKNILTDSGGFQVFSLSSFRKITEEGVKFRSHIDGSYHLLSPEKVVAIQSVLGSDIQMQLDVCTEYGCEKKEAEKALLLTDRWLDRAIKEWKTKMNDGYTGQLFGIVQGNFFKDLRKKSAELVIEKELPGIAIGGLSVGESFEIFADHLQYVTQFLPLDKPRYVMGIGTPEFILEAVANGIDMFDCVFPTRIARNGMAFTINGPIAIKKARYEFDLEPLDVECNCKVCRNYSKSYLRHLYRSGEILSSMLLTYHNLYFLHNLIKDIRIAINDNKFSIFKSCFLNRYLTKEY